jgi:hypothetical protein
LSLQSKTHIHTRREESSPSCGLARRDRCRDVPHDSPFVRNSPVEQRSRHQADSGAAWSRFAPHYPNLHTSCPKRTRRGVSPMPSKRMKVKRRTEGVVPIDDQVFMLPWFLPKETYLAVRRILPNIHIAKMRYYFEDYGCMRCERRDVL